MLPVHLLIIPQDALQVFISVLKMVSLFIFHLILPQILVFPDFDTLGLTPLSPDENFDPRTPKWVRNNEIDDRMEDDRKVCQERS